MKRTQTIAILTSLLLPTLAPAANLWWDSNDATPGTGLTPNGTWGNLFWSTSSLGTSNTTNTTTTALDTLTFSAGVDAVGSYTITVQGTQNAQLLSLEEGAVTFSGGTIALGGATKFSPVGGITVAAGAGNATVSSNLSITGAQVFNPGTGRTLALNSGTFTRATGAVLNVQGAGTVTSTMTNLSANNAAGIIGAWASFGPDAATQYATFSGSTIIGLTGTAAATPANVTDTTGLVNYDLAAAAGTMPDTVSVNTLRHTGTGGNTFLGATSFTANGLMNAGTNNWNINNTLTIGTSKELVVTTRFNGGGTVTNMFGFIKDNAGGASALTVNGSGTLRLYGANTYTGVTTISGGNLFLNDGGSLSPSSAIINHGALFFQRSDTATQGIDFASVLSGTGSVIGAGPGTTVLNGANTYTGVTDIAGGTISVATIGNGGLAGNLGAATNAADNLSFGINGGSGTLQYTGATAGTDRSFTIDFGNTGTIEVTTSTSNLTFTGGSAATGGGLIKTGPGTLTLAGTNLHSGTTTVSAGTLQLGNGASDGTINSSPSIIVMSAGKLNFNNAGAQGYNGALDLSGSVTKTGAGNLALSGSFTRATGAVLNVQGAGTVTSTMTNLSANNAAGIIGAWASFGPDAATQYATFSGSTIIGLTGTAAATPANVTDTTGLVNYDLADPAGTMPATVSVNTLRHTGTGGQTFLGATSFTANGLMNAGTGFWDIFNPLTIGASKELVVTTLGGGGTLTSIFGVIKDNGGGASALTVNGTGTLQLYGANTYTGVTTISSGELILGSPGFPGSLSPSSAIINHGTLKFRRSNTATQGIDFASVISGTGNVSETSSGTLVLNGANTYTGVTTIAGRGTISVATIGNGGSAGNLGAATNAAGNLVFGLFGQSGTLQYTGATAGTDRSFTLGEAFGTGFTGTINVTSSASNLTFTGGSAATSGNLIKTGAGTLTLAGTNLHTGGTAVIAGALEAGGAGALGSTSGISVSASGTLRLGGSGNRIGDTVPLTMNGGTFNTAGLSETAGVFTLAGTATIDLGAGASLLQLANSSGAPAWSGTLSITNWTGSLTGGGTDQLFFGTTAGGLTAPQVALISFVNPAGLAAGTYPASIRSTGEVVAVPEPASTALLGAGLLGLLGFRRRRAPRA